MEHVPRRRSQTSTGPDRDSCLKKRSLGRSGELKITYKEKNDLFLSHDQKAERFEDKRDRVNFMKWDAVEGKNDYVMRVL